MLFGKQFKKELGVMMSPQNFYFILVLTSSELLKIYSIITGFFILLIEIKLEL